MKQLKSYLKENKLVILYLALFTLFNFQYIFFVITKTQYTQRFLLDSSIEQGHFEYLSNIIKLTNFLETLILLIFITYFIVTIMKKDKTNIRYFLLINSSLVIGFFIIGYIVSLIFSAPIENMTQQLFGPLIITFIIMVYCIANIMYKKNKHN